jgi:hypothetical protein
MEIARVYFDVDMRLSFQGLKGVMKKDKFDIDTKPMAYRFVLFINRKQTAFKMLVGGQHLVYHNNGSRPFPLEAVQHFPEFFNGRAVNFSGAVRKAILKKYAHLNEQKHTSRPQLHSASA